MNTTKLKSLVDEFISGGTPDTKISDYWDGNIPWVTGADFSEGSITYGRRFITEAGVKNSATHVVPAGAVLALTRTGVGKVAITPKPTAISQDITGIIPNTDSTSDFIRWAIIAKSREMKALEQGAIIKGILRKDLENLEVPVFDLREQARIVELLDQADALRRQRAEANAKLTRLLPALFRHHFGDPLRNDKNWSTELLTKVCEPRQWPTISQKELTESGFTVYGANGPIGFYSEYNHAEPTVLITCRGATCGTINVSPPNCYVTGNAMALDNPDPDRTTNEFLEIYLHARGLSDTITGAAQPQITRANLSVVNVFTPPMFLVEQFTTQVRETKQILTQSAASKAKLETLFQTLLHRAFPGELTARLREAHLREGVQELSRLSRA